LEPFETFGEKTSDFDERFRMSLTYYCLITIMQSSSVEGNANGATCTSWSLNVKVSLDESWSC
jgi:hypothetical protein